ncbi:MAG: chlorophyll synthase ChlG [Chloroflexi bacterium]|nr:chlorophyll synthase ChlG [Chloroflexota bacterium]
MKRKPAYLRPLPRESASAETSPPESDSNAVYSSAQALPNLKSEVSNTAPNRNWRTELKLCLTIIKPITWVPVVWSFWCGAVMAGGLSWTLEGLTKLLVGLILAGPLLCGMAQAINDWFDREVDAVNEPWRPIASGQLSVVRIYQVIGTLGFFGLMAAYYLGPVVMLLAFFGIFMAHNYSAPPLRLKRFTWIGPLSSASSYILVPWLAAASVFGGITWRAMAISGLYTLGGIGIMILNDFKSIRGDYQLKLPSVPVVYGTRTASRLACAIMDLSQLTVGGLLLMEGRPVAVAILALLLFPQLLLQHRFIEKPLSRAIWYNARGQNFLVLGMLVAAWVTF